jgi:TolB-like protein
MKKKPPKPFIEQVPASSADKIRRQLKHILVSPEFPATDRQKKFLEFVVSETMAGREQEIKGYTIATQVFGRGPDFDSNLDPIVSIEANRLRRALERYYLTEGREDQIHIDIPKGTYVPSFHKQEEVETERTAGGELSGILSTEDSWPTLLIVPFENLTGDPQRDFLGVGFSTELATEITRFQEIRVLYARKDSDRENVESNARFILEGSILEDRTGIKLTILLIDTKTRKQIWGDSHWAEAKSAELIAFQEEVARVVAAKIANESGIISTTLAAESKNKPPAELTTYEAILRFYEYDQSFAYENFSEAMEALTHAVQKEPDCGIALSLLARLYGNAYGLDVPGFKNPLEKALEFAEKSAQIEPNNQRIMVILAFVHFLDNELLAAIEECNWALTLNPNSLFVLDAIGYILALSGEWNRGVSLIRKTIKLNPYYRPFVHFGLWGDCIRRKDYEGAYMQIRQLMRQKPGSFWYPLATAATLGLLGRNAEGKAAVKKLLKLKPDFSRRGRELIGYYVKFEDMVECIVTALGQLGLPIT